LKHYANKILNTALLIKVSISIGKNIIFAYTRTFDTVIKGCTRIAFQIFNAEKSI
jgi:hypothetical protein